MPIQKLTRSHLQSILAQPKAIVNIETQISMARAAAAQSKDKVLMPSPDRTPPMSRKPSQAKLVIERNHASVKRLEDGSRRSSVMHIDLSAPIARRQSSRITIDLACKLGPEPTEPSITASAAATLPINNLVRLPPEEKP